MFTPVQGTTQKSCTPGAACTICRQFSLLLCESHFLRKCNTHLLTTEREPQTNQSNKIRPGEPMDIYWGSYQQYGKGLLTSTRRAQMHYVTEKRTPTQMTAHESYIPRALCTIGRQLDRLSGLRISSIIPTGQCLLPSSCSLILQSKGEC